MRKTILVMFVVALLSPTHANADLIVEIGSASVDLTGGSGTTTASITVTLRNPSGTVAQPLSGYTLFLDIGPDGKQLPTGVTFDDPAATYFSGNGVQPLLGAANPGTINLNPAAGDLGVGQFQTFNGPIGADQSFTMLQANLRIDRALASPGTFAVSLNQAGQNTLDFLDGQNMAQPVAFTVSNGSLTLSNSAVPEPTSSLLMVISGLAMVGLALRRRRLLNVMADPPCRSV